MSTESTSKETGGRPEPAAHDEGSTSHRTTTKPTQSRERGTVAEHDELVLAIAATGLARWVFAHASTHARTHTFTHTNAHRVKRSGARRDVNLGYLGVNDAGARKAAQRDEVDVALLLGVKPCPGVGLGYDPTPRDQHQPHTSKRAASPPFGAFYRRHVRVTSHCRVSLHPWQAKQRAVRT